MGKGSQIAKVQYFNNHLWWTDLKNLVSLVLAWLKVIIVYYATTKEW